MGNYLYNGHKMPASTSGLTSDYPYATILRYSGLDFESKPDSYYMLSVMDKMGYYGQGVQTTDGEYLMQYYGIILSDSYETTNPGDRFNVKKWTCYAGDSEWKYLPVEAGLTTHIGLTEIQVDNGWSFEIIWTNVDILDKDGNLFLAASEPEEVVVPSEAFNLKDFLTFLSAGLCNPQIPVNKKIEVLDNEWPITWDYPAILDNNRIEMMDSGCAVKVSSLVPQEADYERLVVEITENGVTSTLKFAELFLQQTNGDIISFEDDAKTLDFSCYVVRTEGEMAGMTFPTRGIYTVCLYSDTAAKKFALKMTEVS